jgi:hypothetical protein
MSHLDISLVVCSASFQFVCIPANKWCILANISKRQNPHPTQCIVCFSLEAEPSMELLADMVLENGELDL